MVAIARLVPNKRFSIGIKGMAIPKVKEKSKAQRPSEVM